LARFDSPEEVVTLGWEYSTFGLTIPADTGILDFLTHMPDRVLTHDHLEFATVSEALARRKPAGEYRPNHFVSLAEHDGKLAPWLGNPMQSHAAHEFYALEPDIRAQGDPGLLDDWRRLQAADYLRAMTVSEGSPGLRRTNLSDSPYDAYINFMNLCDSLAQRCGATVTA
jgi:alpha-amylase/alpha-mannosidase (GH57 family)